jgi:hypothetical protein
VGAHPKDLCRFSLTTRVHNAPKRSTYCESYFSRPKLLNLHRKTRNNTVEYKSDHRPSQDNGSSPNVQRGTIVYDDEHGFRSTRGSMRSVKVIAAATIVLLLFIGVSLFFGGNSARRIEREHGVKVPESGSHFVCGGDAWPPIMDRGAASAFELPSADLPLFLSQLKIRASANEVKWIFPGNSQYQIKVPWGPSATNIAMYQCDAPTGDFLNVGVWRIDAARVGICLYTDWN